MVDDGEADTGAYARLREEVDHILDTGPFVRAPAMARLLSYLLDHSRDSDRKLKSYQIATEALGRDSDFDPSSDSYPRVMVGRLRRMIDAYYAGRDWDRRVVLASGQYRLTLVERDADAVAPARPRNGAAAPGPVSFSPAPQQAARRRHVRRLSFWLWFQVALVATIVIAGLATLAWWGDRPRPLLAQPTLVVSSSNDPAARRTGELLQTALQGYSTVRLVMGGARGNEPTYRIAIHGVPGMAGQARLHLERTSDGQLLWQAAAAAEADAIDEAERIAAIVAGQNGLIVEDMRARLGTSFEPGYACQLQYYALRELRGDNLELQSRVKRCLTEWVERDETNATALRSLAFVTLREARNGSEGIGKRRAARALAERAVLASPQDGYSYMALARSYFVESDCVRGSSYVRRAIALAPADPELFRDAGAFLTGCRMAEGRSLLERAIALDPARSGRAVATLALADVRDGDTASARARLDVSEAVVTPRLQFELVRTLAAVRDGDDAAARVHWRNITSEVGGGPPEAVIARFTSTPMLQAQAVDILEAADFSG